MFKKLLSLTVLLLSLNAYGADYLDTQYADDGLEAHIMKTTIKNNVLTVVFSLENTNSEDTEYLALPIQQVFFNTKDKKYPVLQDAKEKWLASTIAYSGSDLAIFTYRSDQGKSYSFTIKAGKKKVGWVKFEAPADADWPLELNFPTITPFTLNKPQ